MIRIVLADDHNLVRAGLKQLLATSEGMEVIGEACDGHEAMQLVRSQEFEVLVLDMSMPGKSGMELIKQIKGERPKLRILVLSMHEEQQYAMRSFKAGASGYLTKDAASDQLIAAIRKVAAGGVFISAVAAEQMAMGMLQQEDGPPHLQLSDREFEVFRLLVAGRSVTEIADQFNLSVKTVSTHKARLMQKMAISNQADLVRYAMTHRLFDDVAAPD